MNKENTKTCPENIFAGIIKDGTLVCFDDTYITDFVIPDDVTTIAADAFKSCTRLEELTIPKSVTEIELGAFDDCINLSVINVPDNFTLLDTYDLYNTKWYQDRRDGFVVLGTVLLEYNGTEKDIYVPAGVTRIMQGVFENVSWSTVVNLPSTVTVIEEGAFPEIYEILLARYDETTRKE